MDGQAGDSLFDYENMTLPRIVVVAVLALSSLKPKGFSFLEFQLSVFVVFSF